MKKVFLVEIVVWYSKEIEENVVGEENIAFLCFIVVLGEGLLYSAGQNIFSFCVKFL
jgi:hypothetical protein